MSDIFLSYARTDHERARALARVIESRGWSVFFDRDIVAGEPFRDVIARALNSARCVIVLWSHASAESDWVVDEAEVGKQRGILLLDLADWSGAPDDKRLDPLFESITRLTGVAARKPEPEPDVRSGNVFVSYAREDTDYVQDLISLLRNSGLPVWADDRIDFGDRWWRTIVANIRSSVAMVVVMTPAAEESKWVEREILLADKLEKPIFPLLLRGEAFALLITLQHHDVTNGSMPPATVINTLRRLAGGIGEVRREAQPGFASEVGERRGLVKGLRSWLARLTGA
jgi:hypothetical protein